jgi:hypothetical protein
VRPVFRADGAWVYVLPETMPVERFTGDGSSSSTGLLGAVRQARP